MKSRAFWRGVLTLLCITVAAGALLSFVYEVTKEPIARAETAARAEAYRNVYPGAADFAEIEDGEARLAAAAAALPEAGYARVTVSDALAVLDENGAVVGYVLSATSPNGYAGDVKIALGVAADGTICGFEPLAHSESPGYGARCDEEAYRASFAGKTEAAQIDGISGATYTTEAIREAVGAALYTVTHFLTE